MCLMCILYFIFVYYTVQVTFIWAMHLNIVKFLPITTGNLIAVLNFKENQLVPRWQPAAISSLYLFNYLN